MPGKRKANGFIQDLAKCHAAQVVPLLKRADNEQWQELKEVLKKNWTTKKSISVMSVYHAHLHGGSRELQGENTKTLQPSDVLSPNAVDPRPDYLGL